MIIEMCDDCIYKIRIEMLRGKITYLGRDENVKSIQSDYDKYGKNIDVICILPNNQVRMYCNQMVSIFRQSFQFIIPEINQEFIKPMCDIPATMSGVKLIFYLCNNIHWRYGNVLYNQGVLPYCDDKKILDAEYLLFVVYEDDIINVFNYQ